ncbi:MAG: hypothetical protein Q9211_005384 [Gyalolechia sp. 1 TL-2023]
MAARRQNAQKQPGPQMVAQDQPAMLSPARNRIQGSYRSRFKEVLDDSESLSSQPSYEPPGLDKESSPAKPLMTTVESLQTGIIAPSLENQAPATRRAPPTGPRSTYARIAQGFKGQADSAETANEPHRLTGPVPPPLRGFANFPQSNPPNRNLQLGSTRLQGTNKLGPSLFGILYRAHRN